jgi:hypothetical protein
MAFTVLRPRRVAARRHRRFRMRISAGLAGVLLGVSAPVAAQDGGRGASRAVAVDTVIGVQDVFAAGSKAGLIVDSYMALEMRPYLQVLFRPKVWRKEGDWFTLVDQLSLRYDVEKGSNWLSTSGDSRRRLVSG